MSAFDAAGSEGQKPPPVVQPEDMGDEDRAVLKAVAEMQVGSMLALRDTIISAMTGSARWLQASLLLVNGAAAAAVLSVAEIPIEARVAASAAFVVGILFSLLAAQIGLWVLSGAPRIVSEAAAYWATVAVDCLRSEEIEQAHYDFAGALPKRARWATAMGWASVVSFVVGCAIVGVALLTGAPGRP